MKEIKWYAKDKPNSSIGHFKIFSIEGLFYGASTGTFMSYRMQNYQSLLEKKAPKFYAWHCLSIKLQHHTLDLLIPNDDDILMVINAIQALWWQKLNRQKTLKLE